MEHQKKSTVVIQSALESPFSEWQELWEYRELFFFLAWRDVSIRYKQTILGIGWAVIQPLFTMVIFTLFFGRLANISSGVVPYPLFALSGLVPWLFFSNGVSNSSNSVVKEANLVKKVYFPRIIIPFASVSAGVVDFLFASFMLLLLMSYYEYYPSVRLLIFPLVFLFLYMTTVGIGLWLSAWNVLFRDIRHVIPFFVQLWLFVTPIVYPLTLIPEKWRFLFSINPMVGVIELFRWSTLGSPLYFKEVILSLGISSFLFLTGVLYFRKIETSFADVV